MQFGSKKWRTVLALTLGLALGSVTSSAYSASKSVLVLVLGDSLSAEYGLSRGTGWVALLQQRMEQEKIDVTLTNASISGETTSGGATRLPALLKQHPSVVMIELGSNDGLRGLSLDAARKNLQIMIAAAQSAHAKVVLVGMQLPPNYGRDFTARFAQLYPALAAQYHTALVPFLFDGFADQLELFQPDRIHPTQVAQPRLLANVWPHLAPLVP